VKTLQQTLSSFESITLDEMDNVRLMNRTDTKYIFPVKDLSEILKDLSDHYRALQIESDRSCDYKTVYFDTQELKFYTQHHNGKLNRHKVRFRKYGNSDVCYLEIKFKNNKGRTIKNRVKKSAMQSELSDKAKLFIEKYVPVNAKSLQAKLWNSFTRLTLVGKQFNERITIDINLNFERDSKKVSLPELAIVEVKQSKYNVASPFIQVMRKCKIRPMRFSKYCVGSLLLDSSIKHNLLTEEIKYNRFKPRILTINKIQYGVRA